MGNLIKDGTVKTLLCRRYGNYPKTTPNKVVYLI